LTQAWTRRRVLVVAADPLAQTPVLAPEAGRKSAASNHRAARPARQPSLFQVVSLDRVASLPLVVSLAPAASLPLAVSLAPAASPAPPAVA
jgi:hypothetical protein